VRAYSEKIYESTLDLSPSQVVLLTDALCGSTCACFSKHLAQLHNVYAIGFGGAYDSEDVFDVASFAGGAVMDSVSYEDSVSKLK